MHSKSKVDQVALKPFLRWAGGKSRFLNSIVNRMPALKGENCYYEPFLGAGSVFLRYRPKNAKLSDLNKDLIGTFLAIKDNYRLVYDHLSKLISLDCKDFYYNVRDEYNCGKQRFVQAARFIYLNQTCFNGIFRVNKLGKFNVPYGFKTNPQFPSKLQLQGISEELSHAKLTAVDFTEATQTATEGDLVYLDPPYPPINGSSYFTHYTKERFTLSDQETVAALASDLNRRGCFVLITNADTEHIRRLYDGWLIEKIERPRWITCAKNKHIVTELIITNFTKS